MMYTPVRPVPTRREVLTKELGFEDDTGTAGSLSSDDEEVIETVPNVKYQAAKKQLMHVESEREQLLLKIATLKDRVKAYERRILKDESDRKNQLNIMKSAHEQAFSEKNRVIGLFESVVRDQETELDHLRQHCHKAGISTNMGFGSTDKSVAISQLTGHLNQVLEEKNNILAQFFSQQNLIKDQQQELKSLLRCKTENADLHNQIKSIKKSMNAAQQDVDSEKAQLKKVEAEKGQLRDELEQQKRALLDAAHSPEKAGRLEEQINKLQDRLLVKEAELAEMDMKYRHELVSLSDQKADNERELKALRQELLVSRTKEPQIVEKKVEVQIESEESRKALAVAKAHITTLQSELSHLKEQHAKGLSELSATSQDRNQQLELQLEQTRHQAEGLRAEVELAHQSHAAVVSELRTSVNALEQQIKVKNSEMNKMRQEIANRVAELETQRDADLDEAERAYELKLQEMSHVNSAVQQKLAVYAPSLKRLIADNRELKRLCDQLTELHRSEVARISRGIQQAIHEMNEHNKDLLRKYRKEMALRKKYHNELVELRGNIRVFCRVRPNIKEDGTSALNVVSLDADDEDILVVSQKGRAQRFDMDRVFMPSVNQLQVFEEVKPLVTSVVDGFHVCIFAYGQTGSGKTYTMEGPSNDPGINQRALAQLFAEAEDRSKDWTFDIGVSVMEIYNEMVRDLLANDPTDKLEVKLQQDGSLHVPGLTWVTVQNVQDVNRIFAIGHKNRATASTNMNEYSSRSHALLCVQVTGMNKTTGAKTLGKLNLVDLAGSERVSKSGADGARLKEAQSINKSLSSLGDVISALRSKQSFVPYRNSKLTYLLQDSLGGDSKTLMIVQVAPIDRHVSETLCSMNFAQRVRTVELGAASKKVENPELTALKERLAQYEGTSPVNTPVKGVSTPVKKK